LIDDREPFQKSYADYYDIIYEDKDYERECDFLESLFSKYGNRPSSVLDVGCGTGGHSLVLARRGYHITGIDSSKFMLARAMTKAAEQRLDNVSFLNMDMRNIQLNNRYDVAISMFSAINYILSLTELHALFTGVYKCVTPDGLFIFDFWNGAAVMNLKPEQRVKLVDKDDIKIIRTVKPTLDPIKQIIENQYVIYVLKNNDPMRKFTERHVLRFHFPSEIEYVLNETGFRLIALLPFMKNGSITDADWNIVAVARAM